MGTRKDNIKKLFSNTRTRIIIIFTMVAMAIAIIYGVLSMQKKFSSDDGQSRVSSAPGGIRSVPGGLNPTAQYVKLQTKQNTEQYQSALKKGTSSIPTLIKSQRFGEGVESIGEKASGGVGFSALTNEQSAGGAKSLWLQVLKGGNCSIATIKQVSTQGATLRDIRQVCSCAELKRAGYQLNELKQRCSCKQLKATGYSALQLKNEGYDAIGLQICGFNACQLKSAGFTAGELKESGMSDGELKGAGFSPIQISAAGGLPQGISAKDVRDAGCNPTALKRLKQRGVSAAAIRRISGCSVAALKAAGFSAKQLRQAGFTAAELKNAGFTNKELAAAGYLPSPPPRQSVADALAAVKKSGCSISAIKAAKAKGATVAELREAGGCSVDALKAAGYSAKQLKDGGFTAAELKNAGFSAKQLKAAGFSAKALKDAGFSPATLKAAGFSARQLKDAGFSAKALKAAGFSAKALKDAGFSAKTLKAAGFSARQLKQAGFSAKALKAAGFTAAALNAAGFSAKELQDAGFTRDELKAILPAADATLLGLDELSLQSNPLALKGPLGTSGSQQTLLAKNAERLAKVKATNQRRIDKQKFKQSINKTLNGMQGAANKALTVWRKVPTQVYVGGTEVQAPAENNANGTGGAATADANGQAANASVVPAIVKAGEIMFAVLDSSVNSDEPGPVLATIVAGKFKGAKLIGSFNLPAEGQKMTITFNRMSVIGAPSSTAITAFAIDANTARTSLSSRTDNHYLLRYGSLFASSFLEGFGNAFASAGTTVTIGGTSSGDVSVQQGIGRSLLENAVIGLADVGKRWGQVTQRNFNRQPTVQVFAGTGLGILFTSDLRTL